MSEESGDRSLVHIDDGGCLGCGCFIFLVLLGLAALSLATSFGRWLCS